MSTNDTLTKIRRQAVNLLARRDHSQQELLRKLKAKGHDSQDIASILPYLIQHGFLNEKRFTENYIYYRRNKGYGPDRITIELRARGVPDETIAEQLEITDNDWLAEARKVWNKHFKSRPPQDFNERAKQMRFLQYRGFTQEHIEQIFKH